MHTDLKTYGKEVSKIVPMLVKDTSKIPGVVLTQAKELEALNETDQFSEFGEIVITKAEDSKEQKAKQAMPGKPAILLE